MMKIKTKLFGALATLALVLPLGLGLSQVAKADENANVPPVQKVILHKKKTNNIDGDKLISNTGDTMDFEGEDLDGSIFTAYDVTKIYWESYKGKDGTEKDNNAKEAVLALAKDKEKLKDLAKKEFPATGTDKNEDGYKISGQSSLNLPTQSNNQNAVYLFLETGFPAGAVQDKSFPFVLGLPSYKESDSEGNSAYRTEVHVYPKNEVKPVTLQFIKKGIDSDGEIVPTPLSGAQFILKNETTGNYYNTEENKFSIDEKNLGDSLAKAKITSDENGKVSVSGLVLEPGNYSFYEIDSTISTSKKQDEGKEESYHFKENKENASVTAIVGKQMNITYSYFDENQNVKEDQPDAFVYNYKTPNVKKETKDKEVQAGQEIEYTITTRVPGDIANYETFTLTDNFDSRLSLNSSKDDIAKSMTIDGIGDISEKIDGVEVSDVDKDKNEFSIKLTPGKLTKYKNQTITFTVKMVVNTVSDLKPINNEVKFGNDFYDKKTTETIKTGGYIFTKVDSANSNPLAAAKFKIKNSDGKYFSLKDLEGKEVTGIQKTDGMIISWTDDENAATTIVSGEDGSFGVYGLKPGKGYELIETQAPDGYVASNKSYEFEVIAQENKSKELESDKIPNKPKGTLPSTGGKGIYAFIAIGTIAVAGAVFYFTRGRKQTEA